MRFFLWLLALISIPFTTQAGVIVILTNGRHDSGELPDQALALVQGWLEQLFRLFS